MMQIHTILWPDDRVEHVARHNITPDEFDEVSFGGALVLRTKAEGKHPVYNVLGQTFSGRYLFCVVIAFPDGNGFPITARSMTTSEQRRFRQWQRK